MAFYRFLVVFLGLSNVVSFSMHHREFHEFKERFNKMYKSEKDESISLMNFKDNVDRIARRNREQGSYKLGINQFSDCSFDFLKEHLLLSNFAYPEEDGELKTWEIKTPPNGLGRKLATTDEFSGSGIQKDWRREGCVTRVKDQGSCGSCWAFSTTGALESMILIHHKKKIELSEQELVSCSDKNYGCNGGWMHKALDYVKEKKGLFSDADYPYLPKSKHPCRMDLLDNQRIVASGKFDYYILPKNSIHHMQDALLINPLCIAVDADFDFIYYKEGIYDRAVVDKPSINHAVLLTGVDSSKKIWMLKNSWGIHWGENGYMNIALRDKSGVAGMNTYCIVPKYRS